MRYNLEDAVNALLNNAITDLFTSLPGIVSSFDRSQSRADVTLAIGKRYSDELLSDYPPLTNLPVIFPRTYTHGLNFDLKPGDTVMVFFAMRSMEEYLTSGEELSYPVDNRRMDINDAYCVPGIFPFSGPLSQNQTIPEDDVAIYNENASIGITGSNVNITGQDNLTINVSGEVTINTSSTVNLDAEDVNVTATNVTVDSNNISLGGTGRGLARIDDTVTVDIVIPSGSSAGNYTGNGTITSASSNVETS